LDDESARTLTIVVLGFLTQTTSRRTSHNPEVFHTTKVSKLFCGFFPEFFASVSAPNGHSIGIEVPIFFREILVPFHVNRSAVTPVGQDRAGGFDGISGNGFMPTPKRQTQTLG
jgi:hypothetical protein